MTDKKERCGKAGCKKYATGTVWGSLLYHTCDDHREEIEVLCRNE